MDILAALPRSIQCVYFTNWFVAVRLERLRRALAASVRGN
jgi:hypothetical protein